MFLSWPRATAALALAMAMATTSVATESLTVPQAEFGELRTRSTIHSLGIEWDITGDGNHNASCSVRFRKQGDATWRDASALLRIDYRGWYEAGKRQAFRHFNMLAGSVMFLEPATAYELELSSRDPDGGGIRRTVAISTRSDPVPGKRRRTLHVIPGTPGDGGGNGTESNPFKGIDDAQKNARPGDTFLMRAGTYEGTPVTTGGNADSFVVWKPAGDGEVVINNHIALHGNHVWFEGLVFTASDDKDFGGIRGMVEGIKGLVVIRNTFRNCRYALSSIERQWDGDYARLHTGWYFADNVVDGGPRTEYGTRIYMLADSDLCYNRITTTHNGKGGDAISLRFCTNVDVYNNDVRDLDDDGFEPDSSYGNIRIYCNRIVNPKWHGISLQPMFCSPWYILRNEFVLMHEDRRNRPFKTNVFDRMVLLNNTFVVRARYGQLYADLFFKAFARNNLWIYLYDNPDHKTNPTGAVWSGGQRKEQDYLIGGQAEADWKTDTDYNGFSWEGEGMGEMPFWWDGVAPERFNLTSFAAALGVEKNSVSVKREEVLESPDVLAYSKQAWTRERLMLKKDSAAIDAGAAVANLCEGFTGARPDLGAHELNSPVVHYGPRNAPLP